MPVADCKIGPEWARLAAVSRISFGEKQTCLQAWDRSCRARRPQGDLTDAPGAAAPKLDPVGAGRRHRNRSEAGDVFVPHSAIGTPRLDEADLKPTNCLAEADKHCSGTLSRGLRVRQKACHYSRMPRRRSIRATARSCSPAVADMSVVPMESAHHSEERGGFEFS